MSSELEESKLQVLCLQRWPCEGDLQGQALSGRQLEPVGEILSVLTTAFSLRLKIPLSS